MGRTPQQIEDERLALRCRLGEPAAFAEVVETMERPLLYFARTFVRDDEVALDVLQAVWITAFRELRRLDQTAALRSWLYRIARGHAVGHVHRDVAQASAERSLAAEYGPTNKERRFGAEDSAAVPRALAGLDVRQREVLVSHFLEDLPPSTLTPDRILKATGSVNGCSINGSRLAVPSLLTEKRLRRCSRIKRRPCGARSGSRWCCGSTW